MESPDTQTIRPRGVPRSDDWAGTGSFAAGEGICVDWAGTLHETRTGGYRVVAPPGGRTDDEFHVNGVIDGHVVLVPDDPARPSYVTTRRETWPASRSSGSGCR